MGLVAIVVVGVDFGWALVDLVSFDYGDCDGGLWVAGMATRMVGHGWKFC